MLFTIKIKIKRMDAIKITVVPVIIFPLLSSFEYMDKIRIIFLILIVEVRLYDFLHHLYMVLKNAMTSYFSFKRLIFYIIALISSNN